MKDLESGIIKPWGFGDYGSLSSRWSIMFHFIGFNHLSLGLHVDPKTLNVQVHLPFGFLHLGRTIVHPADDRLYLFGIGPRPLGIATPWRKK